MRYGFSTNNLYNITQRYIPHRKPAAMSFGYSKNACGILGLLEFWRSLVNAFHQS